MQGRLGPPGMMCWTDKKIDHFRTLFDRRDPIMSFGLIALELGVSRSAAIGKASRLGWWRKDAPKRGRARKSAPAPKSTLANYIHRVSKRKVFQEVIVPDVIRDLPPVSLFDARADQCRWPIGEPSQMMLCGDDIWQGSYCACHAEITTKRLRRA